MQPNDQSEEVQAKTGPDAELMRTVEMNLQDLLISVTMWGMRCKVMIQGIPHWQHTLLVTGSYQLHWEE